MKKRCFSLLISILLFFALTPHAILQTENNQLLYQVNFDEGNIPSELVTDGAWEITSRVDKKVLHIETSDWATLYWADGLDLKNYIYEVKIKVISGNVALWAYYVPSIYCHAIVLTLMPSIQRLSMGTETGQNCERDVMDAANDEIVQDDWLTVRLEVGDGWLRSFINDKRGLVFSNFSHHQQGTIGLLVEPDSEIEVAEMRVWQPANIEPSTTPRQLTNYAAAPSVAVQELMDKGLIPPTAQQVFYEDYAFLQTGNGTYAVYLAEQKIHQNIVIAGEATFRPSLFDQAEECGLLTRITPHENNFVGETDLTIVNDGTSLLYDYAPGELDFNFLVKATHWNIDQAHHLLLIVDGDTATAYIDGQLVFDHVTVVAREGFNGIVLNGRGTNPRCEVRNIWAYQFDSIE